MNFAPHSVVRQMKLQQNTLVYRYTGRSVRQIVYGRGLLESVRPDQAQSRRNVGEWKETQRAAFESVIYLSSGWQLTNFQPITQWTTVYSLIYSKGRYRQEVGKGRPSQNLPRPAACGGLKSTHSRRRKWRRVRVVL